MRFSPLLALLAAGLVFFFASPALAQSNENCGGEEQPACEEHPKPPHNTEEPPPVKFVLTVGVAGNGDVGGPGISCPGDCGETYPEHTVVVLVPIPAPGWRFIGWSGDCGGK